MDKRREILYLMTGGMCLFCKKPLGPGWHKHHGGKHDTKGNNLKYPLFTQSLLNLFPVHEHCHLNHPGFGSVSDREAELWETLLLAFVKLDTMGAKINLSMLMKELQLLKKSPRTH